MGKKIPLIFIVGLITFLSAAGIALYIYIYIGICVDTSILTSLPYKDDGFTCTGLFGGKSSNEFYIGNIGKSTPDDEPFHPSIEVVTNDFKNIKATINLDAIFNDKSDVQGICIDNDDIIWACSCTEDRIYSLDLKGNRIGEIDYPRPSGISYNSSDDTLWVLNSSSLCKLSKQGVVIEHYTICVNAPDQIYYDSNYDIILITGGDDYDKEQNMYVFDICEGRIIANFRLDNCFAIEGISVVDGVIYILNDGFYHDAKIKENYCATLDYESVIKKIPTIKNLSKIMFIRW